MGDLNYPEYSSQQNAQRWESHLAASSPQNVPSAGEGSNSEYNLTFLMHVNMLISEQMMLRQTSRFRGAALLNSRRPFWLPTKMRAITIQWH